ncbi:MAG: hypothetical protein CMJ25_15205 [Phycisphaerae bacterium]|nr:hypothetical protein [Phycisphaerae bacterium]|tara:strand:+ start:1823 stop:2941 length:1119 start_codon:yes stop_codon:yes gene_type:complete
MTIKQTGGIFGRNVTLNDVEAETVEATTKITTPKITNGVTSGTLTIGAGAAQNTGANILMYGEGHAQVSDFLFRAGTTQLVRIQDSGDVKVFDGDVLIGTTNVLPGGNNVEGIALSSRTYGGHLSVSRSGDVSEFNRIGSDGRVIIIRQGGGFAGAIATRSSGGNVQMYTDGGSGIDFAGDGILPMASDTITDNSKDVGSASFRWDDIYATNGTIQTSDRNEKQDIEELSDAEQRVAVAAKGLLRKFRWKSSVAENGDNARTHFGIIAQDLQAAFAAEGLDAGDYAMFISTTWWEQAVEVPAVEAVDEVTETSVDEDGNEIVTVTTMAVEAKDAYTRIDAYSTEEEAPEGATQRTRLGVRYSELLAFIIAST